MEEDKNLLTVELCIKTTIFYFSGTGNSFKLALDLKAKLPDVDLVPIQKVIGSKVDLSADKIGFVFPVYAWGPPVIVGKFMSTLSAFAKYSFAIVTYGGFVCGTLKKTEKILQKRGIDLNAGFMIKMPGNYTPLYGAVPLDAQKKILKQSEEELDSIIPLIKGSQDRKIPSGFWIINVLMSGLAYNFFAKNLKNSSKHFWITKDCNGCGICEKVCPVKNIELVEKKPVWADKCLQCMACLQWCPVEAVQVGKKTISRRRYHHPDVKATDLFLGE